MPGENAFNRPPTADVAIADGHGRSAALPEDAAGMRRRKTPPEDAAGMRRQKVALFEAREDTGPASRNTPSTSA
ncbi:MAG: hypothetical protein AB2L09_11260 [Coriobacteriia bacterium]